MTPKELLKKIYTKTYITLFAIIIIFFLISLIYSKFLYNEIEYHPQYFAIFIRNSTLNIFFKNLMILTLTFFTFCYAIVINKGDLITKDGSKILFADIVSRGIYILFFLTILHLLAGEFIIPALDNNIEAIKNSSTRAKYCLQKADESLKEQDYVSTVKYYEDYLSIINDKKIEQKLREIKNKIEIPKKIKVHIFNKEILEILYNQKQDSDYYFIQTIYKIDEYKLYYILSNYITPEERNRIWLILKKINFLEKLERNKFNSEDLYKEDSIVIKNISDYLELARIYFAKQDYLTAWYYYQYVYEIDKSSLKNEALEKIKEIKIALKYQNSSLTEKELEKYINDRLKDIKNIYNYKQEAEKYFKEGLFQKSFFIYNKILFLNSNLRDAIQGRNKAYQELSKVSCEFNEIKKVESFHGKSNVILFLSSDNILFIKKIIKIFDSEIQQYTYYFYDVNIYNTKDNSIIKAPYGQIKNQNLFTLYCYDFSNEHNEYYPVLIKDNKETLLYNQYLFNLPIEINIIYNFSYSYNKIINLSLYKLFQLKNFNQGMLVPDNIDFYEFEEKFLSKIKNQKDKIFFQSCYSLDKENKKYIFNNSITFDKKILLYSLLTKIGYNRKSFSIGYNENFIKTAILDKISRMFLFFSISLIIISLVWKLKANYITSIPVIHFIFFLLIPIFYFILIQLINSFFSSFLTVLSQSFEFLFSLILCLIVNIIITIFSIIFIATNSA